MRYFILAVLALGILSLVRSRRRARERAAAPKSGAHVAIDPEGISVAEPGAAAQRLAWSDVGSVHIESVDGGLSPDDVFWVLQSAHGGATLRVAQTAPGADQMIARLQQFPGFRYEPMINSMITTEATRFLVWERAAT